MPPPHHPPITPSPHRFLPSSSRESSSKPPQPKQPPTLRSWPRPQTPQQPQQFAITPRFSFASRSLKADDNHDQNPCRSSAAQPLSSPGILRPRPRLPVHAWDVIEEGSSDEGEDGAQEGVDDVDFRAADVDQEHPTSTEPYFTPCKRRRRFKPAEPIDSDTVIFSSSPTPSPSSHERAPSLPTDNREDHDNLSSPPSLLTPSTTTATSTTHPRFRPIRSSSPPSRTLPKFLLPDPSSPPPLAPPHALSSPQRRTAKFVPGGLAATMRDLVVETAAQQRLQQHPVRGSRNSPETGMVAGWEFRVRVRDVRSQRGVGAGMVLVREEVDGVDREGGQEGEGKGWVLVGPGTIAGVGVAGGGGNVRKGDLVGVKRPVWGMKALGELWTVGVDWAVLQ